MNHAVQQVTADITAMAAKSSKMQKDQAANDDRFMNMLSDAMSGKPNQTVKKPEQAEKDAGLTDNSEQATTQAKPNEKPSASDIEDSAEYEQQVVAAVMQMQVVVPVIEELPIEEVIEEVITADEPVDIQMTQAVHVEAAATEMFQQNTKKDIPSGEAKAETTTAGISQTTEAASKTEVQKRPAETAEPQAAQPEKTTPDTTVKQTEPQQEANSAQRQTIRQRPDTDIKGETVERPADGEDEAQTIRQPEAPRPLNQMRNHRDPEQAQSRFDGMIARASRELNPNAAAETTQSVEETPEEAPILEQPITIETKPNETAKQPELPKTETKPQEEAKPTEHVTVQKNVKAPVTEQRPQQEISKVDEAVLGMTQTKQPEIIHEVIRAEAPQQPQQVQVPDQAEQIKTQVLKNMENERTEFQMQLQPEELGKVNVKMILEAGKLSVEIAAINPKSAEMLSRQVESLAASLKASGADVSSINVVTANENVSAQMDSEYNLNNFQNREQGQGQGGHTGRTNTAGETGETNAQAEREPADAPQRILNYSV